MTGVNEMLRVIKIGGSAITVKKEPLKARENVIKRVGEEVKPGYPNIVLTHGTGSFGHPLVLKQNLHVEIKGLEKLVGISNVKYWVSELTQGILRSLIDSGIPAFPFYPSSFIILENDEIRDYFIEPIERFLRFGVVPVIPADGPFDRVKQMPRIASGDYLAYFLAEKLGADEVIFTMDVDGLIYQGETLEKVERSELLDIMSKIRYEGDATGGIRGKLEWVSRILDAGIRVTFINLVEQGRLRKYLKGEKVVCTRFIP